MWDDLVFLQILSKFCQTTIIFWYKEYAYMNISHIVMNWRKWML